MKQLLLMLCVFSVITEIHASEFFKKHGSTIIATSTAVITGGIATYYYWSISSQIDAISRQQNACMQKVQAVQTSVTELQEHISKQGKDQRVVQVLEKMQTDVADLHMCLQSRSAVRRTLLSRGNSKKRTN